MMERALSLTARRNLTNTIMTSLTAACALVAVCVLLLILGYIAYQGITAINWQFLTGEYKPLGEGGGIGHAILGSLILLSLASVIGMPTGIACGIYLAEFGDGWFAGLVRFVTDTLTGVPSIIVGVFVYTLLVLPSKHYSALAGGIALSLVMIPIVARTTEEMIRLVPTSLREGALALGAPQWRVTMGVVLPAAASGIATGAMLAIARVSGETAPLLLTVLGSRFFNWHLDQPIASLPVEIYNNAISAYEEENARAWAATLVLMTLILAINLIVRFFTRKKV
jgi:phosphate transport system permease protein